MKTSAIASPQAVEPPILLKVLDPATVEIIDRRLALLGDLHSAPQVVQKILAQTRRLDFDLKALTDTLATDPALSAKVLRLVNSASFGLPRKVTALPQAVMILGQRTLRLLVMTFALVDKLTRGLSGRLYGAYWRNALTMAIVAGKLSQSRSDVDADEAYSAGLLSDLGILALAQTDPERYADLFLGHPHDSRLLAAERDAFGCDHTQVGYRLLERWGFAPSSCLAARYHHELRANPSPLEITVTAATLVADMLWSPRSEHIATTRSILRAEFAYGTDDLIGLALCCKEEIVRQAELHGVEIAEHIDVDAILEEARKLFVVASLETAMDFDAALAVMTTAANPEGD